MIWTIMLKPLFPVILTPTLVGMMNIDPKRTLSYLELYKDWLNRFSCAGTPEPKESAGYILAHLLGRKTFSVIPRRHLLEKCQDKDIDVMRELCQQRLQRMPVQYVIGEWDFFGINLKMKPPVLIPRPETEELAGHALRDIGTKLLIKQRNTPCKAQVLEVGSGSGAISLSLLKKLGSQPVRFIAIDSAEHASNLTQENAKILGLDECDKLSVLHHTLAAGEDAILADLGPYDVIVSNPPYISTDDMKNLPQEISRYEDWNALHGGKSGMDIIDVILKAAEGMLSQNGSIWLEVDSSHSSLVKRRYQHWISTSYKDIFGKERFCHLTRLRDVPC